MMVKNFRGIRNFAIIFGLAVISSFAPVKAQWAILRTDADSLVRLGSDYIYNVQFDQAEREFREVIKRYPTHPAGYFLDAMVDWWKIQIYGNSQKLDNSFLTKINRVIGVCNVILDTHKLDINALFFKGGALGFRGRFYANKQSWLAGAKDGKEALEILNDVQTIAPSNYDIMLGTGVYNYFAVKFLEQYPFLKPMLLFLPSGDKEIGILQLRAAAQRARYAAVEAKVVLMQIYYSFENMPQEALEIATELHQKYPQNPYFHRYYGRTLVRRGYLDEWEKTWREALIAAMDKKAGYDGSTAREAMYYIGTALMMKGNYEGALKYFYKADEASRKLDREPSGFMIQTNLKIGKIFDLQNKRKYAVQQYQKILRWKDKDGSHEEASKYLNSPYHF
ncbi:MAG: tetratricopeptide repeat protein [Chloroflexota bacterium]